MIDNLLKLKIKKWSSTQVSAPKFSLRISVNLLILLFITCSAPFALAGDALTIAVARSPLALPFYIAENEGYFIEQGLQVKINEVIGGHRAMQQLLNNEADLATASEAVVMFNSFKRNDYSVLATFVTSNDDVKIVTRKGEDIVRIDQLVGKKIGTIPGSASHYYLDNFLISHGVDPKKIKIVALQAEAMAAALKKGDVDAVVAWEPYAFETLQAVEGAKAFPNTGAYVLSFNLVIQAKLKNLRDDELVKVLSALEKAQRFIKAEPLKAQKILRSKLQLDQGFVDWIWPRIKYQLSLNQPLLTTMESEARWARQEGHVVADRTPNFLNYIYTKPLRMLNLDAVGIVE